MTVIKDIGSIPMIISQGDKVFRITYHHRRDKTRTEYTFYCVVDSVKEAINDGRNYCRMNGWTMDRVTRIWEGKDYELKREDDRNMIENDYLEKIQKAETLSDLQKIAKEIYSEICRESLIDGEAKTMAKIYTLATIVLKVFIFKDW